MHLFLKYHYLNLASLLFVVFAVYGYSITFDFVWDDNVFISNNPVYSSFDFFKIFTTRANGIEYLPVRDLTFVLDFFLWDKNPWGFHLSNVLYFTVTVICIYLFANILLTKLKKSSIKSEEQKIIKNTSLLTAVLFALLPLNCEAVCFINCRNVLISGIFFYLACIFFISLTEQRSRTGFIMLYTCSIISFILALFSKATAIVLPGILLLTLFFNREKNYKFIILLIPFFIMSALSVPLFHSVATESNYIPSGNSYVFGSESILSRIAVAVQIPFFYLKKIIFPFGFSPEYVMPFSGGITDLPVIAGIVFILLLTVILFLNKKKLSLVLFSFGWFIIALVPVMNFFSTNPVVADRYAFFPSFGILLLFSNFIFSSHFLANNSLIKITIIAMIIIGFATTSFQRSNVWKNDETLWLKTILDYPETGKAYINLASYYFEQKKYDNGLDFLDSVTYFTKDSSLNNFFKGRYFFESGQYENSIPYLERTIYNNYYYDDMAFMLTESYLKSGKLSKALKLNNEIIFKVGGIDSKIKERARHRLIELQPEISMFLDSIKGTAKKNPGDLNSILRVAIALDENGFFYDALEYYKELEKSGGENWILFFNMGNVYKKINKLNDAFACYQKSHELNKKFPDTCNNMALIFKEKKEYEKSIEILTSCLNENPYHKESNYTLAQIYFLKGDKKNALKYFNFLFKNYPEINNEIKPYLAALK